MQTNKETQKENNKRNEERQYLKKKIHCTQCTETQKEIICQEKLLKNLKKANIGRCEDT